MAQASGTRVGRFELRRCIGAGGFGTVFEAFDPEHGSRFALKILNRDHYTALYGFKQEFRALADVFHPNLVRLHELATDGEIWFFTMELVEGVTFLEHVWQSEALPLPRTVTNASISFPNQGSAPIVHLDPERLTRTLNQLAQGLVALHERGKLHRDVKPSNVLVAPDGRVVLLDFGLVTDIRSGDANAGRGGTPGYMSPEQSEGRALRPASDWFSVGVMLHQALTGNFPSPDADLLKALPDASAGLASLCRRLLNPREAERPNGAEVLALLSERTEPELARSVIPAANDLMFGRDRELAQLQTALGRAVSGSCQLIRVVGRSGIGKTKLVDKFLQFVRSSAPDVLVLGGRCYEHETVPYKALDSLMDALGRHVIQTAHAELEAVPSAQRPLLARLFRVFQELPDLGDYGGKPGALESQEQRSIAFSALRDLVHRLARRRPLLLFVDDVHWGDADSARLLTEIIRAPCRERLMVVIGYRQDQASEFLDFLDEAELGVEQQRLELTALGQADARNLARHLLPDEAEDLVDAVTADAGGSPIFIQQLAHQAFSEDLPAVISENVDQVVRDRVARLSAQVQDLLKVVAVAGQPVPQEIAARTANLEASSARSNAHVAAGTRLLIMRSSKSGVLLELAHDRVRAAILATLSEAQSKALHERLANAFLAYAQPDIEALARHFAAAGDEARTREYSAKAGERAESAFAFERAARHWALLASVTAKEDPTFWQLLRRWGEALMNAGKAGEASDLFERAMAELNARDPNHADVFALSRRSGELALRSGRLDVGLQRMQAALIRVGVSMPRSRSIATGLTMGRRVRFLARGFATKPRRAEEVAPATKARLDALWGASTGLSMTNYVLADALGVAHLLEALDNGAHSHVIRALGYEAAFEALIGGKFFRSRAERMLVEMDRIARESEAPYDRAWAQMSRGIVQWFAGDWAANFRHCSDAASIYREHCQGVAWELAICDSYRLPSLIYLGDLTKVAQMVPRALNGASERGDIFAAATLRMGQHGILLLRDDAPEQAIAESLQAITTFPKQPYVLPHYQHLVATVQAELYLGHGESAYQLTLEDWPGIKQARLLNIQCLRVEIQQLKARAAIANSIRASTPSQRRHLRGIALALADKLASDQPYHAAPFAAAVRASVHRLNGHDDLARTHLSEALRDFEAQGMQLYAEAARDRLGALEGGDGGAARRAQSLSWMTAHRVKKPAAMVAMLLPGV